MKGPVVVIGQIVGAALGGAISKEQHTDPVKGAVIGMVTMVVARKLLPARVATIGAAVAAGYVTRKIAQRAERREAARKLLPLPDPAPAQPGAPARVQSPTATTTPPPATP